MIFEGNAQMVEAYKILWLVGYHRLKSQSKLRIAQPKAGSSLTFPEIFRAVQH